MSRGVTCEPSQLAPMLEALVTAGSLDRIRPDGPYVERALSRGSLLWWDMPQGAVQPTVAS